MECKQACKQTNKLLKGKQRDGNAFVTGLLTRADITLRQYKIEFKGKQYRFENPLFFFFFQVISPVKIIIYREENEIKKQLCGITKSSLCNVAHLL